MSLAVALALLLAVPLNALLGPDEAVRGAVAEAEESVLRMGFMHKVDSVNPFIGLTDAAYIFYGLVYDALHSVGENLETTPNLALGWRVADGVEPYGSAWDYDITPNARWHDGEPFTPDDVVYNINLNSMGDNFTVMWAYQPYTFFMQYAERIGNDTVRIHFYDRGTSEPIPASYADLLCIPMVPKHMLEGRNAFYIGFQWSGFFDGNDPLIVGTGPFMATPDIFAEFIGGDQLTLVKNPNYHWGPDRGEYVKFDKIVMYFYDDPIAMRYALENGQLDIAQLPRQTYRPVKEAVESGTLKNVTAFDGLKCTQYWTEVGINMNRAGPNPSRLDPAIRQALAMATNKTYIVDQYYLGFAEEGSTLISPVSEWHYEPTSDELYDYDLDAAAAMLEAAGYRYPYPGAPLRAATSDSLAVQEGWVASGTPLQYEMLVRREYPEEKLIAQYLQAKWAEIGIGIEYIILDEPTLGTYVYGYAYDTMIWYWSSDPDPNFMLFCQSKKGWYGWSDNKYYNPAYEENYTLSVRELNETKRKEYVDSCQRINYLDAAYIILAYTYQTYAWRTDTFVGWGDWSAHPGRSVDACWTGNPLYFDLEPAPPLNMAPVASFSASPTTVLLPGSVTVDASTSSDVEDDVSALLVRWDWEDDGNWDTDYSTAKTAEHSFSSPGTYTIRLEVKDTGGETSTTTRQVEVLLDEQPPVTTISAEGELGSAGWYISPVVVTLEAVDDISGVAGTWYRAIANDAVVPPEWVEYTGAFIIWAQGNFTVEYYSVDFIGNSEAVKNTSVKVDTLAPVTACTLQGSSLVPGWYVSAVTADLFALDSSSSPGSCSGVSAIYYRLDTGSWDECAGQVVIEADGAHTLESYAVDVAGHESAVAMVEFSIDLLPPDVTIQHTSGVVFTSGDVSIWWSCFDDVSGPNRTEVSVDGSAFASLEDFEHYVSDLNPAATCLNLTGLEDGNHWVEIRVTDNAGLVTTARLDFSVDTGAGKMGVQFLGLDWWIWLIILCVIVGLSVSFLFGIRRNAKGRSEKADVGSARSGIADSEDRGTAAPPEIREEPVAREGQPPPERK